MRVPVLEPRFQEICDFGKDIYGCTAGKCKVGEKRKLIKLYSIYDEILVALFWDGKFDRF